MVLVFIKVMFCRLRKLKNIFRCGVRKFVGELIWMLLEVMVMIIFLFVKRFLGLFLV